jgi:hypothetical protein
MRNWKATLSGSVCAITAFVSAYPSHFGGEGTLTVDVAKFVAVVGLAFMGLFASDRK